MTKNTPRIFISLLLMLLCIGILHVSNTHLRAQEKKENLVGRLLLEKNK